MKWDADFAKRKKIKAILDTLIPEFSVRLGGATSIDVTKPGIDKAYGIKKLRDVLGISVQEMIYVGDALFPGGNDYPAEEAGVISIPVKGPRKPSESSKRSSLALVTINKPDLLRWIDGRFPATAPRDGDGTGGRQSQRSRRRS